jgi:uncharacterized repeat protein (TIGR03803 family)
MEIPRAIVFGVTLLFFVTSAAFGQKVRNVFSFPNANSATSPGTITLIQGRDSELYGTTTGYSVTGGTDGSLFKISVGGKFTTLHIFSGADGSNPQGGLTLGIDGNYYGTTTSGGTSGAGTLFKVTPSGTFTSLYQFTGSSDGSFPYAPPIQGADGNLYGTTPLGNDTLGTVYRYTPSSGSFNTILSLNADGSQGKYFEAPLLQAADGTLYGTTAFGGVNGCGAIVRFKTSGALLNVYSFACGSGGSKPLSALMQAGDGTIYGTTAEGGNITSNRDCGVGCGTIFELTGGGVISTLYAFSGEPTDGGLAIAGLVEGTDGQLYGSTHTGGAFDFGTLYRISTNGQYQLLYSFAQRIGAGADGTLVQDTSGLFYATTSGGGNSGEGSLYNLNMGLGPFIALVRYTGRIGQPVQILGQDLTGTTSVTINGVAATSFKVVSDTYMTAVVPTGATTGPVVVTTPAGSLTSNHNFQIVH